MAHTMQQAVKSELAFNPLSSPDGQGEVFVGANQNALKKALEANGWSDLRFVSKEQVEKAGWQLADSAVPVQITFRNSQNAAQWDNKVLFNASQVIGMPALEDMLAVAQARLTPELEPQALVAEVAGPAVGNEVALSAVQQHEQELWKNFSIEEQRRVAQAQLDALAAERREEIQEEDDLVVGPGKRVLDQEDVIAISPVFREKGIGDEGPEHIGEPVVDHAVPMLLGSRFKERVPGSGEYLREGEKKTAFLDKGGSLVIRDKQQDTYQAVMELAKSKGWQEIELSGKPESLAKGWLEAQLLGIKVANYVPTEKDLAALDRRRGEMEGQRPRPDQGAEKPGQMEKASVTKEAPPAGARVVSAGFYVGPVVDIVNGFVVQKDGPDKFVAHKLSDFDPAPKVGEPLDVQYKGGRATVMEPRVQGKEVGGGREIGGRG